MKIAVGEDVTTEVQSVKVVGIQNEGTYSWGAWSIGMGMVKGEVGSWTTSGTGVDYTYRTYTTATTDILTFNSTTATLIDGNGTPANTNLILMPQSTVKGIAVSKTGVSGAYIEVVYRAYDKGGNDIVGKGGKGLVLDDNRYVKAAFLINLDPTAEPAGTSWLPKKQYIYTLNIANGSGSGNLVEDRFINESGAVTTDEVKDPTTYKKIEKGDPIINTKLPIIFTQPTVGDWDSPATSIPLN